jgi:exo-beta-1,3-glucanase (GH17 family)
LAYAKARLFMEPLGGRFAPSGATHLGPVRNTMPCSDTQQQSGRALYWTRLLALLIVGLLAADRSTAGSDLAWLRDTRFVAYTPSEFTILHGTPIAPGPESIAADLRTLRPHVDGLITYSTAGGLADIVELARQARFEALILGVWSPADGEELDAAIARARQYPQLVRAIVVGNEGLFWKRYTRQDVERAMVRIRREAPHVAVTTSEPFAAYLDASSRYPCDDQDFLLPNIHPIFESWFRPEALDQATEFVVAVQRRLYAVCRKFVLIKETGIPSGPASAGFSPALQRAFWRGLLAKLQTEEHTAAALFEAFDAPWKVEELARDSGRRDPREAAWGWFTSGRTAKPVVELLRPTRSP